MTADPSRIEVLKRAERTLEYFSPLATDGTWLEELTVELAPFLADWDVEVCYPWGDWPYRAEYFPNTTKQDIGIDLVAHGRSDGRLIAVQCKARKLDLDGTGAEIGKGEVSAFSTPAANDLFVERWLVTNGANPLNANAQSAIEVSGKPIKVVNLAADLTAETVASEGSVTDDDCPHCKDPEAAQTRTCMQREAVARSVRILKEHVATDSGGLPEGQARGRIILPCGAGKTRVALRIVEELTDTGQLSVVLCPSIALVAQLRREFLQHASSEIRTMAVCSDQTAGYDPKKEGTAKRALDPTQDNSNVSASEVKGLVTTDPFEIADWMGGGGGVVASTSSLVPIRAQAVSRERWNTPAEASRCSSATRRTALLLCAATAGQTSRPGSKSSRCAMISRLSRLATASTKPPRLASTTMPPHPPRSTTLNSWFAPWTTRRSSALSSTARAM